MMISQLITRLSPTIRLIQSIEYNPNLRQHNTTPTMQYTSIQNDSQHTLITHYYIMNNHSCLMEPAYRTYTMNFFYIYKRKNKYTCNNEVSLVMRKPVFRTATSGFPTRSENKPGCITTEDGESSELSNFEPFDKVSRQRKVMRYLISNRNLRTCLVWSSCRLSCTFIVCIQKNKHVFTRHGCMITMKIAKLKIAYNLLNQNQSLSENVSMYDMSYI